MKAYWNNKVEEIRHLNLVNAADICNRGAQPLCIVNNETVNQQIFTELFQEIDYELLLRQKIFGIN
ncbi:hypothetical protein [uncultured Draconibacterium sp.]|uniref:hypothetical protein n=1 Tax=uncultured Draconibacterium sp. TaxID=1573823 RepID=UPI0025F8BCAB|nr:hypothetical protein [uncultured Draconibacterium sp.]